MSTTMTLTMREAADVASVCPNCGIGLPHPSSATLDTQQQQIEDLQAQVRLLTQKATAAGTFCLFPKSTAKMATPS
jgi:uncharacterized protein YbbK (DUF523 family)